MTIQIGKTEKKQSAKIDLPVLLRTRLGIQANSGGGKSWLIRKILEETYAHVPQIVFDMEGEFATLREKYDYVLVAKDGDVPISIQTADLLARKILENRFSVILDLYELKAHERHLFVKRFLESMMNAKKDLWGTWLIVIDEAHHFAPESKAGKSEAFPSVIDLCTRGRKRGYCAVLATQRISKMSKDAWAELNNQLIGRASLDIDMARAGESLGFREKSQFRSLRDLEPGEFYAFGPALSKEVQKITVGKVQTTHPEAGQGRVITPAPASQKVVKALAKLADLPKQAEDEVRDVNELRLRVRQLEREAKAPVKIVDETALERARKEGFKTAESNLLANIRSLEDGQKKAQRVILSLNDRLTKIAKMAGQTEEAPIVERPVLSVSPTPRMPKKYEALPVLRSKPMPRIRPAFDPPKSNGVSVEGRKFGVCEKKILAVLAKNPDRSFKKSIVGLFTDYSHKSGSFNNALSNLNSAGLIERSGENLRATAEGVENAEAIAGEWLSRFDEFSISNWVNNLPKAEGLILQTLLDEPMREFTKEEVGEKTNYSSGSGSFNNAISRLNSLALIQRTPNGIRLHEDVVKEMGL